MRTILALAALLISAPALAQSYEYTARTENPVLQAGQVRASSLTWNCSGHACRISGPWRSPGVGACAQLAQIVGRITEYGHPGAQLNAAQLATCNEIAAQPRVINSPAILREAIQRPVQQLPRGQQPQIDPDVVRQKRRQRQDPPLVTAHGIDLVDDERREHGVVDEIWHGYAPAGRDFSHDHRPRRWFTPDAAASGVARVTFPPSKRWQSGRHHHRRTSR